MINRNREEREMRHLSLVSVVTLLLTAPVFAADEHEHGTREEAAGEMQPAP
jgi:hypothetical protein